VACEIAGGVGCHIEMIKRLSSRAAHDVAVDVEPASVAPQKSPCGDTVPVCPMSQPAWGQVRPFALTMADSCFPPLLLRSPRRRSISTDEVAQDEHNTAARFFGLNAVLV
jgi:hypothetical protein